MKWRTSIFVIGITFLFLFEIGSISATPWSNSLNDGLNAYWTLNNTADDSTGQYDGTNSGASNVVGAGKYGDAYNFTANDYINISYAMFDGENMTIAMWIKPETLNENDWFWSFADSSDSIPNVRLLYTASQVKASVEGTTISTGISPALNEWSLLVYTLNSSDGYVWINGTFVAKTSGQPDFALTTGVHRLGDTLGGASNSFRGLADEVGLWNRSLTKAEVERLWNNGLGITYNPNPLNITITLDIPANNSGLYKGEEIDFIINSSTANTALQNISLFINDILNETKTITGTTNETNFTKNFASLTNGDYNWSVEVCDDVTCLTSETRFFELQPIKINSVTYNATTYESVSETFYLNVTGASSVNLVYNGTSYTASQSGGLWSKSLASSAVTTAVNKSFYWEVTNSSTYNSSEYNQTINPIILDLCNSTLNVPFINFTFKDEADSTVINAKVDSSTWTYWLGDSNVNKTLSFSNTTDPNPSYAFCFSPVDKTMNVDLTFKYSNTSYPQRTFSYDDQALTNSTTNQVLYLLNSDDGVYSAIQTQESSGTTISEVLLVVEREINSVWTTIGQQTTGSDGLATFWVNPNFPHRITGTKSGYASSQVIISPSQSTYTLVMSKSSGDSTYNGTLKGMKWTITPSIGAMVPATYTFGFNLTSSTISLDGSYCKLELVNADTDAVLSSTTGGDSSGCNLSLSYAVTNNAKIRGKYYIDTTDTDGLTLIDADAYWIGLDKDTDTKGFFYFLEDLKDIPEFGDGLRQEYSRVVFFFFLLILVVGISTFFIGYDSQYPGIVGIVILSLVWLASFAGWFEFAYLTNYDSLNKYSIAMIATFIFGGYFLSYYNKQ